MTKPFHSIISLFVLAGLAFYPTPVIAQSRVDLQDQIEEKSEELEDISGQIQETQSTISDLQSQGASLQSAISSLDAQIDQVNYGIRSSEVSIEKLTLELQALGFDLEDVTKEIGNKEVAISEVLRKVQQNDGEGMLEIVLKHDTLADSVFEIQSLQDLQDNLSLSVAQLTGLQHRLQETIDNTNSKKEELEDESITLKSRKNILSDQQNEKDRLLTETKNTESVYQQRLAELRAEQQAILDEISAIEDRLRADFDPNSVPGSRPGLFTWPVILRTDGGLGVISQVYGETAYSSRYYKGKPHNGTDIAAPIGTKVYAAASGVVERVDYNGWYYQYGRYILINHGNNLTTLYAHLSRSAVSAGQVVEKGQLIGYVGNTGFSTGAHLHFGVYATPPGGWRQVSSSEEGGLVSIPPASGLVPIGVTLAPEDYL